jgi:maltoporin
MVTVQHVQPNVLGGFNKLAVQYANGTIAPMTSYPEPGAGGKAQKIRVVEQMGVQPNAHWSGMAAAIFEDATSQYGGPASSDSYNSFRTWSIGARPAYHVNDYLKLQLEVGYQLFHAKGPNLDAGRLFKATFAPTLTPPPGPGGAYYTRPELRLFVTYAAWNEAMRPYLQNGNGVYYSGPGAGGPLSIVGQDNFGVTFGAQVEAWF